MENTKIESFESKQDKDSKEKEDRDEVREVLKESPFWETLSEEEQNELVEKHIREHIRERKNGGEAG